MPQSTFQIFQGYLRLSLDTLIQRFVNRNPPHSRHPLFMSPTYLQNKTIIVTGANTGIGFHTARIFALTGARVILACRNLNKAQKAADLIIKEKHNALVDVQPLDLSDFSSVRNFIQNWQQKDLHVLVLNGGVMAVDKASPETHMTVNHVGHALLTLGLLENIHRVNGRIISVTSLTMLVSDLRLHDISFNTRKYNWMTAYANSKLAMFQFLKALEKRIGSDSIYLAAIHPGEATSDVARNLGSIWMWLHQNIGQAFLLSPEEAARTTAWIAACQPPQQPNASLWHRVWKQLNIPQRLITDQQIEQLWDATMEWANITDDELDGLRNLVKQQFGDLRLVRSSQKSK